MKKWKNYIKGVFDTKQDGLHILVTGGARLGSYTHAGDSLAGRYRVHHLLPIGIKEIEYNSIKDIGIKDLMVRGGFPEPLLAESLEDSLIWRKFYSESLIREDVLDFKNIDNLNAIKKVFELLQYKVGSPIAYTSLAGDIGISPKTVKNYISILEALYIVFLVKPYTKKIGRSILKEPKVYFYDTGIVKGDEGVIFENLIAVSLLKHSLTTSDETGIEVELATLRNKEKKEVDFVIATNKEVEFMVEVKLQDGNISPGLLYFNEKNKFKGVQVVKQLKHPKSKGDMLSIVDAESFLGGLRV